MHNLDEILQQGEDSKTQFKSDFTGIDALAAEISAMANTKGGVIAVGVSDDAQITGVRDLHNFRRV